MDAADTAEREVGSLKATMETAGGQVQTAAEGGGYERLQEEEEFVLMVPAGHGASLGESSRPRHRCGLRCIPGGVNEWEVKEETIQYAREAVEQHNKEKGTSLELVKLVKVSAGIVGGLMLYLTLVARDDKQKERSYRVKFWCHPFDVEEPTTIIYFREFKEKKRKRRSRKH
ncbi:unnamed protein product [Cuscuta campestris]|uniref:Cysteine proteinase inhibitor n=1 Tax=Cuscuta campestris TaxID=132261 RepID=A0A484MFE5_9ASTE|nr:unnamed protein product [Cuscuta campestris]